MHRVWGDTSPPGGEGPLPLTPAHGPAHSPQRLLLAPGRPAKGPASAVTREVPSCSLSAGAATRACLGEDLRPAEGPGTHCPLHWVLE